TSSLDVARAYHTATLLPSGQVLVAGSLVTGGATVSSYLASAELYEPAFVGTPPTLTSASSTSTGMRVPFSLTLTTTGNPVPALTESGTLPGGITFVENGDGTATLSGEADAGTNGTYPITLSASNGVAPDATQSFTLTVTTTASAPAITSSTAD